MQLYYLLCKKCNGYYQLDLDEFPEDFESLQNFEFRGIKIEDLECSECGGDLILTTDRYEYYDDNYYEDDKKYKTEYESRGSISRTSLIILLLVVALSLLALLNIIDPTLSTSNNHIPNHLIIGSDYRGYVTKDIYSNSFLGGESKTIAIVTGIHPREKLSKSVASDIIKNNYPYSNLAFVHYNIAVTDNPDNYKIGRNNGEGLAADYILPDILKSNDDLVIICHDHKPGYGQGFYIATPEMDEGSIRLAESVNQTLGDFNYFRADNTMEHSTSAIRFSKPLASAGYKTFVYEIPEWVSYREAYNMTNKLINACSNFII